MESRFEVKTTILGTEAGEKQSVRVLNRIITKTADGYNYEADPKHARIVVEELGIADAKPAVSPAVKEENAEDDEHEETVNATLYRLICARLNYLSLDRPDIQYATKEASRRMSCPKTSDWAKLKRIGKFLLGKPRLVWNYKRQKRPEELTTYTDSDYAGCQRTRRSTSGGAIRIGQHTIRTWAKTQETIALSSGEAELYAAVKAGCETLGVKAIMEDLGWSPQIKLMTDASAAIGTLSRAGMGKMRHINVNTLWLQQKTAKRIFKIMKVDGKENPADAFTKPLDSNGIGWTVRKLGMVYYEGKNQDAERCR